MDDVKMKRRDSNSSRRKVVAMSRKDMLDTRSKVKDIKAYFMRLTKDPKLDDGRNISKQDSQDDDGVSSGMIMRQNDDKTNLCCDDEKVSSSKNNIKCELGPSICASVELSDDPGPKLMMSRVSATDDEGGGRVHDDEKDLTVLYSSVHQMSNEKVARERRWSMKSGLLTRDTIDQKQTSSVTR